MSAGRQRPLLVWPTLVAFVIGSLAELGVCSARAARREPEGPCLPPPALSHSGPALLPEQCRPAPSPPLVRNATRGVHKLDIVIAHCCERLDFWTRSDKNEVDFGHINKIYVYSKCTSRYSQTLEGSGAPQHGACTADHLIRR